MFKKLFGSKGSGGGGGGGPATGGGGFSAPKTTPAGRGREAEGRACPLSLLPQKYDDLNLPANLTLDR